MKNQFQKWVGALATLADRTAMAANIAGTMVVLSLVLVVNFDVIAREFFNAPFRGAVEVVQFTMVLIVFLQLPDVVRVNRLTRSDGFLVVIGHKMPRLSAAIRHVIDAVSAIFMSLIAIAIWPEFRKMWETQDYFGIPGIFVAPWWPIKLVIFLSAALCTIVFVLKVLRPAPKPELIKAPEHEDS
jgi:TRAP-type C4-dicarboxylate transport system permease small subunit